MAARSIAQIAGLVAKALRGNTQKKVLDQLTRKKISASQVIDAVTSKSKTVGAGFTDGERMKVLKLLASNTAKKHTGFKGVTSKKQLGRVTKSFTPRTRFRSDAARVIKGFDPRRQAASAPTPAGAGGGLRAQLDKSNEKRRKFVTGTRSKNAEKRAEKKLDRAATAEAITAATAAGTPKGFGPGKLALAGVAGIGLGSLGSANTAPDQAAAKQLITELILNQQSTPQRQSLIDAQEQLTKVRTLQLLTKIMGQADQVAVPIPFG